MPGNLTAISEFTPFGYLRNPGHRARSWGDVEGGNLRSTVDYLGVEWVYPLQRDPSSRRGIGLATRSCRTRADFEAIGLTCRYHSCNILGFDWQLDGLGIAARFFLIDDDTLGARVELTNLDTQPRAADLQVFQIAEGNAPGEHVLVIGDAPRGLRPGESTALRAVYARGAGASGNTLARVDQAYEATLSGDLHFAATCPTLRGDWPTGWREGLHYDFQTTRLIVQPPGGIFDDVWPSWMSAWPRVVVAEGTLDMLRLAYADPDLAKRTVLSMFRWAPQPNVPCVFEDGGYNMLAADGSRCGTSPAWCLPFLNLQLLYLRTLDRDWLRQLYPYLEAYLEFWLLERTDAQGWLVYKCTWESGEDGNPRLDPSGSGDGVISDRVRPVELQATLAHAAQVMAFFAAELGAQQDVPRWRQLEADYRRRTQQLFDPSERRYKDWLTQENCTQYPRPDTPYWNTDSCRWSPLALTPLLIGEPLDADELWRHANPPWTLWPSWTYVLVESAAAAGHYPRTGEVAAQIIDRVYRVSTRRQLGSLTKPMPGTSPEFWPEDWRTYQGHDAYGWGATTANLLLRHVFGFKESLVTDHLCFELTPALPRQLLQPGHRLGIQHLRYRGLVFDLDYVVSPSDLQSELDLGDLARRCRVFSGDGNVVYDSQSASTRHAFGLTPGGHYRIDLT